MSLSRLGLLMIAGGWLAWSPHVLAEPPGGPTTGLSPELRAAFIAEMQSLDSSLQSAVSAVARADWAAAERAAHAIEGSFILEQRLTDDQLTELRRVLPAPFVALDRSFHERAERLALAARSADAQLAAFATYKLTEACISCHAQYARHRFPGLSSPAPDEHH